jgi:hypothetical protein
VIPLACAVAVAVVLVVRAEDALIASLAAAGTFIVLLYLDLILGQLKHLNMLSEVAMGLHGPDPDEPQATRPSPGERERAG